MAKTIKQISVFSENKPGKLFKIAETLGKANVNIRALMIAESGDFGIVRLIVDKPEDAYDALRNVGFTVSETNVIGIRMDDQPGGLLKIADVLASKNINMDYA
ncbi:MAG: ACT domain-containing protein, partial [Methanosarcinaceae archaeon]|nr:ACT domain-containing protein [Methanosarcinaceae archaeon]